MQLGLVRLGLATGRVRGVGGVVLAGLLGLAALLAPSAGAEASPSAYGDRLVALINQARADQGLHALTVTGGTSTVAAGWTQHLDSQQALSHNPDLGPQLESHGSPNWTACGENVGEGPTSSADALFKAYMNSPEHRDNILNASYRYLGIGVVFDGSTAWNTLDFVDQYSTSKPRTSTPSQSPTPTTTTAARTTTRTAPRPAAPPTVRLPHTDRRPAAGPRPAAHRPSARRVTRAAAPAAAVPAVPLPLAAPVDVTLPDPMHVPGRDTAPFAAAAAMILLVVATRYVVEVFPRRR